MHVSLGPRAATEIAASETLAPFNDFYEGVIEWRLEKQQDGKARPSATIARWNMKRAADNLGRNGNAGGRVLVVTRLGPGAICHVGYVDAVANANANDLAREIADKYRAGAAAAESRMARNFDLAPGRSAIDRNVPPVWRSR